MTIDSYDIPKWNGDHVHGERIEPRKGGSWKIHQKDYYKSLAMQILYINNFFNKKSGSHDKLEISCN